MGDTYKKKNQTASCPETLSQELDYFTRWEHIQATFADLLCKVAD